MEYNEKKIIKKAENKKRKNRKKGKWARIK